MAIKVINFSIEHFNGHNDLTLWQQRVKNIVTQQGLEKALMLKLTKMEKMTDEAWEDLLDMENSTIQLYLADNIFLGGHWSN